MRLISEIMPDPQCSERHSRDIAASPEAVWRALAAVTMQDLSVTRPLMVVRHLGRGGQPGPGAPLLTDGPVTLLACEPGRHAFGGAIMRTWQRNPERFATSDPEVFRSFVSPGWVKVGTDFELVVTSSGCRLSTETRCVATDRRTRRRFAVYWALIRPFTGLVRRDMLRTVDRLATSESSRSVASGP